MKKISNEAQEEISRIFNELVVEPVHEVAKDNKDSLAVEHMNMLKELRMIRNDLPRRIPKDVVKEMGEVIDEMTETQKELISNETDEMKRFVTQYLEKINTSIDDLKKRLETNDERVNILFANSKRQKLLYTSILAMHFVTIAGIAYLIMNT